MATTKIADVIVPERFTPYVQQLTAEKTALIQSGVVVRDSALDAELAGGGVVFNSPSFKDLTNDDDNVSSDDDGTSSSPKKIGTSNEMQVRLSRNQSWSSMDLTADLAGADPMGAIATRVGNYWARRLQAAFVATVKGVFADNDAAPAGTEHTRYDLTKDIKGASYSAGVTDFSAEAFIDTQALLGDAAADLGAVMVHSIVFARMKKNNLIDYIPDSNGVVNIPTFLGLRVIQDDSLPYSGGVFETWLFGNGAVRWGQGAPQVPTEIDRAPAAGNGGGQETLYNRTEWIIHPVGHAYVGTAPNGGPSNAATSNNLANAGSWQRVFPERKQIKVARLITREF